MARSFDGLTDRIDWSSIANLTSSPITISAWIYSDGIPGAAEYIFEAHQGGNTAIGISFYQSSTVGLYLQRQGTTSLYRSLGLSSGSFTGAWHHVLATHNGTFNDSTTIKIYVDGNELTSLAAAQNGAGEFSATGSWSIGGRIYDDARNFGGDIAELAVWDAVLSGASILGLSQGDLPSEYPTNLKFYYSAYTDTTTAETGGAASTVDGTTYEANHPISHGNIYEDALSLSKQDAFTLNSGLLYSTAFTLSKQVNLFTVSELGIVEVALSLARNLSVSLSKTSAYAIDDVILEWTTQVLNTYNEAFSLSKTDNISLSSILTAESSLSLNRQLAVSLLTNIVQSVTIDLAKSLNISLLAGANYSDTLSLSKQLAISLSEIKSIEMAFALGKQLNISTISNAVYLASVSLAKTLDLSLISSATYETAISLIRDLVLILDATVTGSAQTYEEAFALSKTLSVTKSTLLDAIEALTLARSLAISVSASMISNENFALGKQLSISLLSGLLLDSALSLIRDEAFTTNKTLILNENIGLVEYHAISDSALAEMATQLSLGKSVSISVNASLVLEEDITLGKVLAIQISGGKVFDDAFVLSILQAIATASSVILFVGQIPAKLVINDQTVWLVSAHDNLVSDDIIETDTSQSDMVIKDIDHV